MFVVPELDGGETQVLTVARVQLGQIPEIFFYEKKYFSPPEIFSPNEAPVEPRLLLQLSQREIVQLQT